MRIETSTLKDVDVIFDLYRSATIYQKEKKTVVVWPVFEVALVKSEIQENRQFKLIIDNVIACVWVVTFSDAQIWEARDLDPAIYIHRIATHPNFRGQRFMDTIVGWACSFAAENKKRFVRLDTIGENTKLINYYTKAGFDYLGMFHLKNTDNLPPHYQEGAACLFQIDLERDIKVLQ